MTTKLKERVVYLSIMRVKVAFVTKVVLPIYELYPTR